MPLTLCHAWRAEARLQKAAAYFLPSSSESDDDEEGAASDGRGASHAVGKAPHVAHADSGADDSRPHKEHKRKRKK